MDHHFESNGSRTHTRTGNTTLAAQLSPTPSNSRPHSSVSEMAPWRNVHSQGLSLIAFPVRQAWCSNHKSNMMSDANTFTLVSAITVLFMFEAQDSSPPKFVTMLSRRSQSIGSARACRCGHGRPVVDCHNCGCRRRFPSIFPTLPQRWTHSVHRSIGYAKGRKDSCRGALRPA